jgi:hypothetical protein
MNTSNLISAYVEVNILLLVSFCLWKAISTFTFGRLQILSPTGLLRQGHLLLGFVFISPLFMVFFPKRDFTRAPIQIWSAGSFRFQPILHQHLSANELRFQDWQLAILAYNAGERQVQKGIDATGSRDAWKLIAAGYDGDQNYLAQVMATIIIEKNPSILD